MSNEKPATWAAGETVFYFDIYEDPQAIYATAKSDPSFCDAAASEWLYGIVPDTVILKLMEDSACEANSFIYDMILGAKYPGYAVLSGRGPYQP